MRESDNMMQQQKTQQAQILTQLDQSLPACRRLVLQNSKFSRVSGFRPVCQTDRADGGRYTGGDVQPVR